MSCPGEREAAGGGWGGGRGLGGVARGGGRFWAYALGILPGFCLGNRRRATRCRPERPEDTERGSRSRSLPAIKISGGFVLIHREALELARNAAVDGDGIPFSITCVYVTEDGAVTVTDGHLWLRMK